MTRAQRQIERHRKGAALIQVRDQHGQALPGVQVSLEQETHQFLFGCLVSGLTGFSADDRERYRRRLGEVFNVVRREDNDKPVGDGVLTVDLSNCRDRMHLAIVRRKLDQLGFPAAHEQAAPPKLDVYVSGKTIGLCDHQRGQSMYAHDEKRAAQYVANIYTLCFSHPSVRGIFWRGVCDREREVSGGGLLRRNLAPKHAHKTLQKLIRVIWHTRHEGETDPDGQFRVRGFFGSYRVVLATHDTLPVVEKLDLAPGDHENAITMHL